MRKQISTSLYAIAAAQTAFAGTAAPLFASTDGWDLLNQVEVTEEMTANDYQVRKVYPSAMEDGIEQFDLTGYVVLLWSEGDVSEFMLISDMGFCPFCGDPEHGTALQVSLAEPSALSDGQRVTLRGALEKVTDPQTTQSARLTKASILYKNEIPRD